MSVRITPGDHPYTGGTAIEVTQDKVINLVLREQNNLLHVNGNNELYCDLQLQNGLKPTDTIPVGRTVGRVLANDGWIKTGTLVCEKTTSGDMVQLLYADDGTIWINRGNGWVEMRDRHSIFVTQAEYNALPNSKNSDGNCYIIVDAHYSLMPFLELIQLTPAPNAILDELNKYPKEYAEYYYENEDIQMQEYPSSVLPRADAYLKVYTFTNGVYVYQYIDTNLTEQELSDMGVSQEYIETVLAGEWAATEEEPNPN